MSATAEALDPVFRALADPTRRQILDLLREAPRTTGDLADQFAMSRFGVMKHLEVLVDAQLVVIRRVGRERWNYLNAVPLQALAERWMGPFEASWASGLMRLKRHAEQSSFTTIAKGDLSMPETMPVLETVNVYRIAQDIAIDTTPAAVWRGLTTDIGHWWGPPYAHGDPTDVILEATPGGRFMQELPNGGGSLWCTVTRVEPESVLEMRGHMGMTAPVMAVICFTLEAAGAGTLLKLEHTMVGPIPPEVREGYASGWSDLLGTRLKQYLEQGIRAGARK